MYLLSELRHLFNLHIISKKYVLLVATIGIPSVQDHVRNTLTALTVSTFGIRLLQSAGSKFWMQPALLQMHLITRAILNISKNLLAKTFFEKYRITICKKKIF